MLPFNFDMRHQIVMKTQEIPNEAIAALIIELKDFSGLSFSERMTLSQIKVKCLTRGSEISLSDEEIDLAKSLLTTANRALHA